MVKMLHIAAFRLTDTLLGRNYLVVLRVTARGWKQFTCYSSLTCMLRIKKPLTSMLRYVTQCYSFFCEL